MRCVYRYVGRSGARGLAVALLFLGQPARVVPAEDGESQAGDGAATNALIFKKRPRRQYTSAVTINAPDAAVSAPVMPKEESRRPAMEAPDMAGSPLMGRNSTQSTMQGAPGGKRRTARSQKDRDREEEDWLLTPQQRIQKEIDILSGKEEEKEEESYGWLADEVESIREEKVKERDRRKQQEEEEAEAEELAAIMGRTLPGGQTQQRSPGLMRDDRGRLQMPVGSEQRRGFGADATNTVSAPALRVRTDDGSDRGMSAGGEGAPRGAGREDPQPSAASGSSGSRNELQRLNERYAGAVAERNADGRRTADAGESPERAAASGGPRTERTADAQQTGTGIASPFAWNSSSGGGYAGLPASVAPSIMPAPGSASAASPGNTRGSGWTIPSGSAGAAGSSASGSGSLLGSRWPSPPPAASPNLSPAGGTGRPGATAPLRTPFMNPMTPGLQGGTGYGNFPARGP
jgi:hypothetical protein